MSANLKWERVWTPFPRDRPGTTPDGRPVVLNDETVDTIEEDAWDRHDRRPLPRVSNAKRLHKNARMA
jgi:hypothetical protein